MGQVLHRGILQGREPVGAETCVDNELAEVGGFRKVTEGDLVRRSWVDGSEERIWKPSLRIRLRLKTRIVGGDERQVVGVSRWTGGVRVMETTG